jgi:4-hydroxybenzoate polyprenyltransferase
MRWPSTFRPVARLRILVRWDDWYDSKLPPVWITLAAAALGSSCTDRDVCLRILTVLFFTCCLATFGHLANDYSDRESDDQAGKKRLAAYLSLGNILFALSATAAAGTLAISLLPSSTAVVSLAATSFALALGYSCYPLRLKDRGWLGIVAASAAQRTLPCLCAWAVFGHVDREGLAFVVLAQFTGLRWIVVHQLDDLANDRRTGTNTFVVAAGRSNAQTLLKYSILPFEVMALFTVLMLMAHHNRGVWIIVAVGATLSLGWMLLCRGITRPYSLNGYKYQPLNGFYYFTWPLGMAVLLTTERAVFGVTILILFVWQWRFLRDEARYSMVVLYARASGREKARDWKNRF